MIIKLPLMLHNIVSKQFKISHVPCDVIAFAKEEIPENITRLIHDQYDEKFLDDCDTVLFVKGPIDKDMRKKIFKAADKALGEGANMMNETDFRLLKLHDDDTADFGQDEIENAASDDTEEQTIDDQVNDIVNEPDSAEDDNTEEEADDSDDNTDAVDKTLAAESIEDNSVSSAMHQGKSMKQWAAEFKGEFTVNQLWAMARSGQDLQRLLLTMNGISSLDDSELNEAKEEKEEENEEDKAEENAEDSKEEDKEKDGDSEAPGKTEENAEDSGSEDDSSDSEEDEEVVPTRFVFLKISMKN